MAVFARFRTALPAFLALLALSSSALASDDSIWWPRQKPAKTLLVLDSGEFRSLAERHYTGYMADSMSSPYHMLAESLAGLAAQAVNEDRGTQLIWIRRKESPAYAEWLRRLLARTGMQEQDVSSLWGLTAKLARQGVVKGYILYSFEPGLRDKRKPADPINQSANAATVMAGLLDGVLVDEKMRDEAEKAGLKMLCDARTMTPESVFKAQKDRLNRHCVLDQSPEIPFCRDLAIAHRMMVCFGQGTPTPEVYHWLLPIGTVFGWNAGDEDKGVTQISAEGHILVASDWALNLTALSAGAPESLKNLQVPKFRSAAAVPASKNEDAVSMMMSDGDNLQWALNGFTVSRNYWANTQRNTFPLAWGLPLGDLLQMAPDVYNYLEQTQGRNTSVALHTGYYYPDVFGEKRGPEERRELLKKLGRRAETVLRATGTSFLTFLIDHRLQSRESMEAYEILARSAPSLKSFFVVQYNPYEAGCGATYWIPGAGGARIPVQTASYSIWKTKEKNVRKGSPAAIAKMLLDRAAKPGHTPFSEWILVHAWSEFPHDGCGVLPARQLAELLKGSVAVVPLEDLTKRVDQSSKNLPTEHP